MMNWWVTQSLDDVPATPWRNGGGVTRELHAWYPGRDGWSARVSVADIERDGPFSGFPMHERWFVVLEGAGVRLDVAGESFALDAESPPLRFDGEAATACALVGGPTRDFNLISLRGTSMLRRVRGTFSREMTVPTLVGLYSHAASGRVVCADKSIAIEPRMLAVRTLEAGEAVEVHAQDALWMEVRL